MKVLWQHIVPFIIAAPIAFLTVQGMDDNEPFIYESLVVEPLAVRPGDRLTVTITGIRQRVCPLEIREQIVDSARNIHELQPRMREPEKLGRIRTEVEVPIPLAAFPGAATYKSTVVYRCNLWQKWVRPLTVTRPVVQFDVMGQASALASPVRLVDYQPDG